MAKNFILPISETKTFTDINEEEFAMDVQVKTGNFYLRASPFTTNTYTGSHTANGRWEFGVVADGIYRLYKDTAQVADFGEIWIGDEALPYLPTSGGNLGGNVTMDEGTFIYINSPRDDYNPVPKIDLEETYLANYLKKDGTEAMTGNFAMGGNKIENVATPTTSTDGATKGYVDNAVPYKHWHGLVEMVGGTITVKAIWHNDTGKTLTFTRSDTGIFLITASASLFEKDLSGNSYVSMDYRDRHASSGAITAQFYHNSATELEIDMWNDSGTQADYLTGEIEIKCYAAPGA